MKKFKKIISQAIAATTGVQDLYAPDSVCFGCGPANPKGLHIKSNWERWGDEDVFVARIRPETHLEAWPGYLSGGPAGSYLDCHSNWCASTHLMRIRGADRPPTTVTLNMSIEFLAPMPTTQELVLIARPVEVKGKRNHVVVVESEMRAGDKVLVKFRGTFVEVGPDHPAFGRW